MTSPREKYRGIALVVFRAHADKIREDVEAGYPGNVIFDRHPKLRQAMGLRQFHRLLLSEGMRRKRGTPPPEPMPAQPPALPQKMDGATPNGGQHRVARPDLPKPRGFDFRGQTDEADRKRLLGKSSGEG